MFDLINAEDYSFLKNDIRFNLLIPFIQAEHHAYKSTEGTICIIHCGMMLVWQENRDFLSVVGLTELIRTHEVKKVFASGKFIGAFSFTRVLVPYYREMVAKPGMSGQLLEAKDRHTNLVADFMEKFDVESFGGLSKDKNYIKIAYGLIRQRLIFLWQDKEITSMCAVLSRNERYARINYVYTREDMRNKKYAQMLVHTVSCGLMKENCIPVLYADRGSPASNAAYKKIGFKALGEIYEYDVE